MPISPGYHEHSPATSLGGETFWSFAASNAGQTVILPDGRCDIIFKGIARGEEITEITPIVTGPATRAYTVQYQPCDVWVGLRLQPWMARSLWQSQIDIAQDHVSRGSGAQRLVPQLDRLPETSDAKSLRAILAGIENGLEHAGRGDLLDNALSLIRATAGQIAIHALADQLGMSERQLNRRFTGQVGLAPKLYASLIRFHRALRLIRDLGLGACEAAHDAGYADQAHLIRSFRRFGGFSPAKIPTQISLPGFSKLQ
ncbi:MAG: helix-turn-helix domain-containing protein [Pelagimonas sp.]|uniref:helix-turn-helix domain-containing protein n=1 Tax=Pelagimonas sp. TaxID=2073170 RepID=UPI003D6B2A23